MDSDYKFTYVDVGCNGRISDGGVFKNSTLYASLEQHQLNLPSAEALVGREKEVPYVIVADDAFSLSSNIMKPYSARTLSHERRLYNYRLSRARRVVENAFGILANRFRVFLAPIALEPDKVEKIVLACCALHNYLRMRSASRGLYVPPGFSDTEDEITHAVVNGEWRVNGQGLQSIPRQGGNAYSFNSKDIRDEFCEYFTSPAGQVPWQESMI